MAETIKSYEDLEVWQGAIELCIQIYGLVGHLPSSERFELSSQMRRSAVSVPSNIAEGHARRQPRPFLNHVNIALGSLAELETCLVIASRLKFITEEQFHTESKETARIGQMLHGLARSLERRLEQMKLGLTLAAFAGCLGFGAIFGALLR